MKTQNGIKILSLTLAMAMLIFFGLNNPAQAQQPNIGVFDLQKALNDSKQGKAARSNLEARFKKMQNDLKATENSIAAQDKELKSQLESKVISNEAARQKADALREKVRSFQEQVAKSSEEMRKAEESALKPIVDKAVKTAGELGKKRGYIMVIETQQAGVMYYEPSMDLTADVLKELNK